MTDIPVGLKIAGAIIGLITACLAIASFILSIYQRRLELQWKQAKFTSELITIMHSSAHSQRAVDILDQSSTESYQDTYQKILAMIKNHKSYQKEKNPELESFHWFFYYVDRLEQDVRDSLLSFDSVKYIFLPYYQAINNNRSLYDNYAVQKYFLLAPEFWTRYDIDHFWERPAIAPIPRSPLKSWIVGGS